MRSRVWAGVVLSMAVCGGWGQQPAEGAKGAYVPTLTFDVASIREDPPSVGYTLSATNPAHASAVNLKGFSVSDLLAIAYGVDQDQLTGLPERIRGRRFDVQAKSDRSVDDQLAKLTDEQAWMEKRHMLQALLADRLQLKIHWETKPSKVYELVVAKSGSKLHPGGSVQLSADEQKNFGGQGAPPFYERGDSQHGFELVGRKCTVELLAQLLTSQMGVSVSDKTGLKGTYDFALQFHGVESEDSNDDPSEWPALPVAVAEQLGLKMEMIKGEKQVLVIDHIEGPSEN